MSLPNPYLQDLLDIANDPETTDANFLQRIGGVVGLAKATLAAVLAGGGGGGGGAATIADGADVTEGALADAASANGGVGSVSAKLRNLTGNLATLLANNPAGVSRLPTCVAHTSSGNTTAGSQRTTFVASSDFTGTLMSQTFVAGASLTVAPKNLDTVGAVGIVVTTGTLFEYRLD